MTDERETGAALAEAAAEAEREPAELQPLAPRKAITYSSGSIGAGIFFALNNFVVPFVLQPLGASNILIGLLSSTRSVEAAVIQPLVGVWSDRTWTRLGRRRIFIAVCVPLCALFLALTPFAALLAPVGATLGWSRAQAALIAASASIFLFSFTFNVMYDPYLALLADITPNRQRGAVNGVLQAFGAVGQVLFLLVALLTAILLHLRIEWLFPIAAALLLLFFAPTVLGIREPRVLPGAQVHARYTLRDYWHGVTGDRQVQLYFAVQFFLWFGINGILPFLSLYAINVAHFSEQGALLLSLVLLISSAVCVWPFGILGDRLGLKRVFFFGMVCMAGAAVAGIFLHGALALFALLTVAGIGNAAQTSSSYPLLTRLVAPDRMGLYTGLNTAITSIAAPASRHLTWSGGATLGQRRGWQGRGVDQRRGG